MRRTTVVLGLVSSIVVAVLGAVAYNVDFLDSSSVFEPERGAAEQAQQTSPADTTADESAAIAAPRRPSGDDQHQTVTETLSDINLDPATRRLVDEDRKRVRESATREVQEVYSLLLEHLGLTANEKDAFLTFLIEDRISRTTTRYSRGKAMNAQERANDIAAIIGDAKLQEFLALEQNLNSYSEIQQMASGLHRDGMPLTDAQRDAYLQILLDVRNREMTSDVDAAPDSIEYLEQMLDRMDENERLVMELAPSVLSAGQVEWLFERYQHWSYQRAKALQDQIRARADDPSGFHPIYYPVRPEY